MCGRAHTLIHLNLCFSVASGETANGKFPDTAVRTMAAIVRNAENASGYTATQFFIRSVMGGMQLTHVRLS